LKGLSILSKASLLENSS